ncbi:MAG: DUF1820 family protein [Nevskiaceae bacterium]
MSKQRLYRVSFTNQGQVYEIYARGVSHGGLLGSNVARSFIPVHAVIRIDEVSKPGAAKVTPLPEGASKVTPFPTFTRGKDR